MLSFDFLLLGLLLSLSFGLKEAPATCDRTNTPIAILLVVTILFGFELFSVVRWWNEQREGRAPPPVSQCLNMLLAWSGELLMLRKVLCHLVVYVATVLTLLEAGGEHTEDGAGDENLWSLLGVAVLLQLSFVITTVLMPMKKLGVFALLVEKWLITDVKVWLIFLLLQMSNFYFALYIVYPRAGTADLSLSPRFNSWWQALYTMLEMAISSQRELPDLYDPIVRQELVSGTGPRARTRPRRRALRIARATAAAARALCRRWTTPS